MTSKPSKLDTSPSTVTMVKPDEKKCLNHFRGEMSAKCSFRRDLQQEKMIDSDYNKEY